MPILNMANRAMLIAAHQRLDFGCQEIGSACTANRHQPRSPVSLSDCHPCTGLIARGRWKIVQGSRTGEPSPAPWFQVIHTPGDAWVQHWVQLREKEWRLFRCKRHQTYHETLPLLRHIRYGRRKISLGGWRLILTYAAVCSLLGRAVRFLAISP
jgi:hypothetical protein